MTNPSPLFQGLGLNPALLQSILDQGYETPTPVQTQIIPLMLAGKDVLAQSQTGSGKTAAFALPVIQSLDPSEKNVQCLVLAPTRELALQVADAFEDYGKHSNITILPVYGGQHYGPQKRALKDGVDVVVGTPGRLLDLIKQEILDLGSVHTVVLDEADEMLSMGFIEDIESILKQTPTERQTTLFSATLPQDIRRLATKYMHSPESVTIERKQMTVDTIEQRFYVVNEKDKTAALTRLFEVEEITSALIFTKTRARTGQLANELSVRGFPAEALNGDLSQDVREQVLNRFRDNQIKVLVATDVAARGLDIDDISHVFNFDMPYDEESYVHRIGRTARAGRDGIAISLVIPKEVFRIRKIEKYTSREINRAELPSENQIKQFREEQLLKLFEVWLRRGRCVREREIVESLVADGHDLMEVAAVALKMARAEEKQRPIYPISPLEEPRSRRESKSPRGGRNDRSRSGSSRPSREFNEKDMVSLSLDSGKNIGVRPADVVGAIARTANIPGASIGRIQIDSNRTVFDIPKEHVAAVMATKTFQIRKKNLKVTLQSGHN